METEIKENIILSEDDLIKIERIEKISSQIDLTAKESFEIVIDSPEKISTAQEKIKIILAIESEINEIKETINKPLREKISEVNQIAGRILKPIGELKEILRTKILKYKNYCEEIERKKQLEINNKEKAEVIESSTAPLNIQTRKNWKYEIINIKEIPREFLEPDLARITKAIRAGVRKIPGVKIYQSEVVIK